MKKNKDTLVITWKDYYAENKHLKFRIFFGKMNKETKDKPLPFLGDLKLKFEIGNPKPNCMKNKLKRIPVNFDS